MSEWIKSGRSSGHAQTFLKLKVYKAEKNPRGGVLDPVSHPKGQGEIKMCTGPVSVGEEGRGSAGIIILIIIINIIIIIAIMMI